MADNYIDHAVSLTPVFIHKDADGRDAPVIASDVGERLGSSAQFIDQFGLSISYNNTIDQEVKVTSSYGAGWTEIYNTNQDPLQQFFYLQNISPETDSSGSIYPPILLQGSSGNGFFTFAGLYPGPTNNSVLLPNPLNIEKIRGTAFGGGPDPTARLVAMGN